MKLKLKEGECLPQGSASSKRSWDGNPAWCLTRHRTLPRESSAQDIFLCIDKVCPFLWGQSLDCSCFPSS